ncbi:hypothetical protein K2X30_05515 [bacterium]|jgi:hypothetical protein|nr:hypothetical protein [bacterium]
MSCPVFPADWQRWVDKALKTGNSAEVEALHNTYTACKSRTSQQVQHCFQNLENYWDFWIRYKNDKLLEKLPEYVREQDPEMGKLPALFKGNSYYTGWEKDLEECRVEKRNTPECNSVKGAIQINYLHSGIAVAMPAPISLLMIPGDRYDKYVIFLSDKNAQVFHADMLTMQKKDAKTGKPLDEKLILPFTQRAKEPQMHPMTETQRSGSCVSCHPNGLREIFPAPGSVALQDREKFSQIQEYIQSAGKVGYSKFFDVRHAGPAVGHRQYCTSCHNAGSDQDNFKFPGRSPLSGLTSWSQIYGKMTNKGNFCMPPRAKKDAGLLAYEEALKKVDQLPDRDRDDIVTAARSGGGVFENSKVMETNEKSPPLIDKNFEFKYDLPWQKKMLGILVKRRLITAEQKSLAEASLETNQKEGVELFRELQRDYQRDLLKWLKGGSVNCFSSPRYEETPSPASGEALEAGKAD